MMRICDLSILQASWLQMLLFLTALCEFILILLDHAFRSDRPQRLLPGCGITAFFVIFSCMLDPIERTCTVPVFAAAAALLAGMLHIPVKAVYCMNHRKTQLSLYAIKEATDDLPAGVCFSDQTGRIILCNRQMSRLSSMMIGSYPQTMEELEEALRDLNEKSGICRISEEPVLYRFPDEAVWRFSSTVLPEGFQQLTAQNVTALHAVNEHIRAENAKLQVVNEKLNQMYERLADRIREQETLELKMRIHDQIGTSLIAISNMMNQGAEGDMDPQLAVLRDAVSYLSDHRPALQETFEEVKQKANSMKVSLILKGNLPTNSEVQTLIAAASRECVTNCIKHAGGSRVLVEVREDSGMYQIRITNDGKPPKGPIAEGGGLSNLRRSVEDAGGQMQTIGSPVFALILNLPGKETKQ